MTPSARATGQPGPPDSFHAFYSETRLQTLRAVRRLAGDIDLAQEVTQEAYARMLGIWATRKWHDRVANRQYTVVIARNLVFDWFRSNRRIMALDDLEEQVADEPVLDDVLDRMALGRAVRAFLDRQPIGRRVVGILYFLEEWSYREIATKLAIEESTVRNQVHRLRVLLKPYEDRFNEMLWGGERK